MWTCPGFVLCFSVYIKGGKKVIALAFAIGLVIGIMFGVIYNNGDKGGFA